MLPEMLCRRTSSMASSARRSVKSVMMRHETKAPLQRAEVMS